MREGGLLESIAAVQNKFVGDSRKMTDAEENVVPSTNKNIVDKKGHTTSIVWKYFGSLQSDKTQSRVHCKLCRRYVPAKSGNTTNLFHHLKQYHPLEHAETKKLPSQPSVNG